MRELKDSELEFLGKIPMHWKVLKVKNLGVARNGLTYSPNDLCDNVDGTLVLRSSNVKNGKIVLEDNVYVSSIIKPDLMVKNGDILICSRNGSRELIGKNAIINDLTASFGAFMMIYRCEDSRFMYYVLNSPVFSYYLGSFFTSTINQLTGFNFGNIQIAYCPDESERSCISNFLDAKCTKINALIADIQSQIDTLEAYKRSVIIEAVIQGLNPDAEMKESNVNWIGTMPSSWDCIRGKYILTYVQKPIREDDGVVTCFRDGEVTLRTNRREDGFTMADKEIGYQGIDVGDLVVHGMDGFAGAIGISDSRGKASPVLNVLDTKQNKRYIMYYLRSLAFSDVFVAMATGIRVRSCDLRWNKLSELPYPVPSIREQQEIVEYIDSMIDKTNAVIADKQSQVATLDEYKKALIYEYVTGKKEVPVS